jgi:acyl-CoA synthetase (AMP-forming)/AMP-acid ligase II
MHMPTDGLFANDFILAKMCSTSGIRTHVAIVHGCMKLGMQPVPVNAYLSNNPAQSGLTRKKRDWPVPMIQVCDVLSSRP